MGTFKFRSSIYAALTVQASDGTWSGRNIADVTRISGTLYQVRLGAELSSASRLAVFGNFSKYQLVAPGVLEITLAGSQDWSLLALSTLYEPAAVSGGGGPPPGPWLGWDDLGDVSGPVVLDGAVATGWRARLVGDISVTWTNLTPGVVYTVELEQDGTGGWAVAWPGGTEVPNWAPGGVDAAAGSITTIEATARTAADVTISVAQPAGLVAGYVTIPGATGVTDIDPAAAAGWTVQAVGDVVLTPTSEFVVGEDYVIAFEQDATGGRALSFDAGVNLILPSGVAGLVPDPIATTRSLFTFRATAVDTLELLAITTAGYEYLYSCSIFGLDDYDLFLSGGRDLANPGATLGVSVSLGQARTGDQATGDFAVHVHDRQVVPAIFHALKLDVTTGGGPNYTPQVTALTADLLVDFFDLRRLVGKNGQTLTVQSDTEAKVTIGAITRISADTTGVSMEGSRVNFQRETTPIVTVAAVIDRTVVCRGTVTTVTAPAPSATTEAQAFTVKNRTTGTIVVNPNAAETFDGAASYSIATKGAATFIWDQDEGEWLCFPGA